MGLTNTVADSSGKTVDGDEDLLNHIILTLLKACSCAWHPQGDRQRRGPQPKAAGSPSGGGGHRVSGGFGPRESEVGSSESFEAWGRTKTVWTSPYLHPSQISGLLFHFLLLTQRLGMSRITAREQVIILYMCSCYER